MGGFGTPARETRERATQLEIFSTAANNLHYAINDGARGDYVVFGNY